ncbi:hypothetical protein [Treponema sp.]|uniref:hypothetical protein n=1 Tax=Treponema sp. TaxID=166 RepID=UPI00298DF6A4|nr:hypothetical protein [Treponema sp.]
MKKIKCIFLAFAILVLGMSAAMAQEKLPFTKGIDMLTFLNHGKRETFRILTNTTKLILPCSKAWVLR